MSLDPEMELWQKEWSGTDDSAVAPMPHEIIAAAARHQRRSHLILAANIVFAVVLLVGSLMMAKRTHGCEIVLWAVCVWMTTLMATYFSLEGWRKSRITTMESVADYARFHRRRAIANQWWVHTGVVLLCVQATIASVWLTIDLFLKRIPLWRFGMAMTLLLVVSLLWVYVFRRVWRRAAAVLETNVEENDGPEAN